MASFRFSLQQVLNYREQLEQQARQELARVEQERLREQKRADDLRAMLLEQEDSLARLAPAQMGERWLTENFIRGLRTDLATALQRVKHWSAAADAARKELVARSKDRKTLEKLKDKQAENHAREERLHEQHEFDETASLRYKASY